MKGTILIFCAALLAGCSPNETDKSEKPSVFVSIPPQAGLLKAMVGDTVEVHTLVGEGQSPHSYEPTARQLAALAEADLLFTIGVPFEAALVKKIRPLYPDLPIIRTDQAVERRMMVQRHHCENCTHDHGEPDPHIWLAPRNAAEISTAMFQTLEPRGIADTARYQALIQTLEKLDADTERQLAPLQGSRFYVFHPAFGYFADRYGLEQAAIELEGKSPSPRQLASLIEQAKADGVKVIFVQKQFPMESGRAVADAISGTVVQLDPLAEDIISNLEQISNAIAESYQ